MRHNHSLLEHSDALFRLVTASCIKAGLSREAQKKNLNLIFSCLTFSLSFTSYGTRFEKSKEILSVRPTQINSQHEVYIAYYGSVVYTHSSSYIVDGWVWIGVDGVIFKF